jgi:hypothetical protein
MLVAAEGHWIQGLVPGNLRCMQCGTQRKVELTFSECENLIEMIGSFMSLSEISTHNRRNN